MQRAYTIRYNVHHLMSPTTCHSLNPKAHRNQATHKVITCFSLARSFTQTIRAGNAKVGGGLQK